jgi:Protein of unknown function (DUF2637)
VNEVATPAWVRWLTVFAVSVVAIVAAVASYAHMHDLALRAGEEWRAVLAPCPLTGCSWRRPWRSSSSGEPGARPGGCP